MATRQTKVRTGTRRRFVQMIALSFGLAVATVPAAGLAQSLDARDGTMPAPVGHKLPPNKFIWDEELLVSGEVLVSIGLDQQLVHVYRDGVLAGVSRISSGRPGYETPRGVYTVLQKKEMHRSNLYDDAPMPFMQRLTWDGLAIHAGRLPGRPDSHGCIRLPKKFAKLLYDATDLGTIVVVDNDVMDPDTVAARGLYAGVLWPDANGEGPASTPGSAATADLNRAILSSLRPDVPSMVDVADRTR